jgi:tetratricopeptide (TPR) repeat protein
MAFGAAVQIRSDYGAAWYQLGVALQAGDRIEAATKAYLTALPFMPDSPNLRYRLGLAFLRQQNWAQVAVHWEDLIMNHPGHPEALKMQRDLPLVYYNLGLIHQQAGRLDKAIEAYEKTIEVRPDYADAYQNLALIYREQEEFDEAVLAHREVVSLRPKDPAALIGLAGTYVLQDSLDRAIAVYRKVLAIEETRVDVRRGLVMAMIKNGDMEGAFQETNRILKAAPKDPESYAVQAFWLEHNTKGVRYGPGFQSQEAVKTYQMIIKMDSTNVRYHYNLGSLYGRMGLWQESFEALLKAREVDSTHAGVQEWLPEVERRAKGEPLYLEIEQKE